MHPEQYILSLLVENIKIHFLAKFDYVARMKNIDTYILINESRSKWYSKFIYYYYGSENKLLHNNQSIY